MHDGEEFRDEPEGGSGLPHRLLILDFKAHLVGQEDRLIVIAISKINGLSVLSTRLQCQ